VGLDYLLRLKIFLEVLAKMGKKNRAESLVSMKLIIIILCIVVLLFVAYAITRPGIIDWLKNLPGYSYNDSDKLIENLNPDQLSAIGCFKLIGRLRPSEKESLIYAAISPISIGGVKTNLHLVDETKEIMLRYKGSDINVGSLVDNRVKISSNFLKESDDYLRYKYDSSGEGLPSLDDLNLLQDSQYLKTGGYFCKNQDQVELVKQEKQCIENCNLYGGSCKTEGKNEISLGKMDCKIGECFVSYTREKLEDSDLSLVIFHPGATDVAIMKENQLALSQGKDEFFFYMASYDNLKKPYCYILRTDREVLFKGYGTDSGQGSKVTISPSNQKIFELVAWAPWDNKVVYKRILLNVKTSLDLSQGAWISDKDFGKKIIEAGVGDVLLVSIDGLRLDYKTTFSGNYPAFIQNFKAVKTGDNSVLIYGYYKQPTDANPAIEWHELDCNGWYGVSSIGIKDLKDSLKETVLKNNCVLK
jgi:hypothetical protein